MGHHNHENRGRGPIGGLVNLIGEGIGLAHEAHASRKRKAALKKSAEANKHENTEPGPSMTIQRSVNDAPPAYDGHDTFSSNRPIAPEKKRDPDALTIGTEPGSDERELEDEDTISDEDENDWIYDDVQEHANTTATTTTVSFAHASTIDEVVKTFASAHHPQHTGRRMSSPIVLPQRRPKTRRRGFIRGYAPCLEECGVGQAAFMNFLSAFDRAVEISPWYYTVNLAMVAAHATPKKSEALAVQVCRESEKRLHMAGEPSTFIDKLNAAYFKPNGLFCFVMTWKPYSANYTETVNMSKGEFQALMSNSKNKRSLLDSLKGDTEKAKMVELPRGAELIFPDVEAMTDAQKKQGVAKTEGFYQDYADRVAQAKFNRKNPTSPFATGDPQFASRYSDPNHPARSGSLLALITGGAINPGTRRQRRREMRHEIRAYSSGRGGMMPEYETPVHGRAPKEPVPVGPIGLASYGIRAANRALKQDLLYLMIVNLPREAELAEAEAILERGPPPEYI